MKKFVMILAALTAAFAFASCERIENVAEDENVSKDYKVVINVADLDGDASTKSIKTSWKSGDIINIWYTDSYSANPVLRIRYDGTKWSLYGTDNPGYDILMELFFEGSSTRKKLLFCYESRNNLSYFKAPTYDSGYRETSIYFFGTNISTEAIISLPLICSNKYNSPKNYAEFDDDGYLHLNLIEWEYQSDVQVVVTGLTGVKPENYALEITSSDNASSVPKTHSLLQIRFPTAIVCHSGASQDHCLGQANEDGIAFRFESTVGTFPSTGHLTFRLIDATKSDPRKNNYTYLGSPYTVTGVEITMNKMNAFRINKSKFNL